MMSLFSSYLIAKPCPPTTKRPVIIVGGGLAGLTAAVRAEQLGLSVVLLEKESRVGGNSAKATSGSFLLSSTLISSSGINACGTSVQRDNNIEDSIDLFIHDTTESGDGYAVPELVRRLATESATSFDWLVDFGASLTQLTQLGGHSVARTHKIPPLYEMNVPPRVLTLRPNGRPVGVGYTIVTSLKDHAVQSDSIGIILGCRVTELVLENNEIAGVRYHKASENGDEERTLLGSAVILATGGFGANPEMITRFRPDLANIATTNGEWARGEGVELGEAAGGVSWQMERIQVHPTGFVDPKDPESMTKFLAPEALRGFGGVLLNSQGQRFANELLRRDKLTAAIRENGGSAFIVLNDEALQKFGVPNMGFYKFKGLVEEVAGYSGLANHIGCDLNNIEATFDEYSRGISAGKDRFGKSVFPVRFSETDRFHVGKVTPAVHYTMGGLKIDSEARVLDSSDDSIPRLYAVGEVTAGVHGANRLGGNSLAECLVFGRIAAESVFYMLLGEEKGEL